MRLAWGAWSLVLALATTTCSGCKPAQEEGAGKGRGGGPATAATPGAAEVQIVVAYGSEKKTWLEEQTAKFLAGKPKTKAGRTIGVTPRAMGSGEATQEILAGTLRPHVFSPASSAYLTLLNSAWIAKQGRPKPLAPAGEPLVLSPIVIAMWRPMAEALGWPGKALGWRDLLAVNQAANGWGARGHPEWGRFKLGHTHPEFSNSGLLAVLAEAYAGAGKTRGLTSADLDAAATTKLISQVEQTIVHYGKSTGFFAEKMVERGPSYLSAAVLYENLVIESYAKPAPGNPPLVAVYPEEGTFWSDHPYAILEAEWVGAEEREAAEAFLAFLRARPQQERALALGFRPADPAVAIAAPIDAAHGVDPKQPQTLLEVPDAGVLEKLLAVWREHKKSADVVLVFDKSGSMDGRPLAEAKEGAQAFLRALHDADEVSLLFFDGVVYPVVGPARLGKARADYEARLMGTIASGGTALYDAVAAAYQTIAARAVKNPERIHALVVMTDGRDESSKLDRARLNGLFRVEEAPVKIFAIAYGDKADAEALASIAEAAKGQAVKGNASTIVQVYQDIAAYF